MRSRRSAPTLTAVVLAALWGETAAADARALAALPLPPAAISRVIGNDLVQNGRRVSIATLESTGTLEQVLDFYRHAWPATSDDPGHRVERVGEWTVIGRLLDDVQLVVQLREGASGPHGFVSALSLAATEPAFTEPPPMPAGGQWLSTTSARDAGLLARTAVISSSARPGEVAGFYRDALRRAGWKLVSERALDGPVTLLFDGRDARVEIAVTEVDGGSVVVFNEVRGDD